MWLISNNETGDVLIVFREKLKYTVGRSGADLLLHNDTSVSRSHAFLHFGLVNEGMDDVQESLELEDAGSKFGTFHNDGIAKGVRLRKGERVALNDGDRIRFGLLERHYTVRRRSMVSIVSALPQQQTQQFEQQLHALGGKVSPNWDASCTHLTMNEATVTVKLLYALLEQVPIVTCDYWRDMLQAARRGRSSLPQPESYLPRCSETLMQTQTMDLRSRPERKSLFAGMTFVFLHRSHLNLYAPLVQKAGGNCKDLNAGVQKAFMVREKVVVIQYVPSTQSQSSQTISSIEDYLNSHSRRIIPEYEIGLAIVHCSTEKYCNPSYKIIDDLMPLSVPTGANRELSSVLVENTRPHSSKPDSEQTVVFVPDTDRINTTSTNGPASTSSNANNSDVCPSHASLLNMDSDDEVLMSALQVTESAEPGKNKRKRSAGSAVLTDENQNSEDDLFNYSKKVHMVSAAPKTRASSKRNATNSPEINRDTRASNKRNAPNSPEVNRDTRASSKRNATDSTEINRDSRTSTKRNATNSPEVNRDTRASSKRNATTAPEPENNRDKCSDISELNSTLKAQKQISKSSIKPLPITTHQREKRTVNLSGFLQKSQAPARSTSPRENDKSPKSKETAKRPRTAVIGDDDDDDDNLFCFGDNDNFSHASNAKRSRVIDSDEELFEFCEQSQHIANGADDVDADCEVATEPFLPKTKNNSGAPSALPKPKPLPQKISTVGWLSCSMDGMSLKSDSVKAELSSAKPEEDDTKQWIESLKGGFEVHKRSVILPQHTDKSHDLSVHSNPSNTANNNYKNFKKFVKTRHPYQSRRVVQTVSVPVLKF